MLYLRTQYEGDDDDGEGAEGRQRTDTNKAVNSFELRL